MEHERRMLWAFLALTIGCLSIGTLLTSTSRIDSAFAPRLDDLSAAKTVEIRDDVERTVLRGDMQPLASLTGILKSGQLVAMAGDAVGKAEIEVTRQASGDLVQEIEIDIGGLAADTHFEVFVDGARVGAIRTDAHGAGELEHYGKIRSAASQATD